MSSKPNLIALDWGTSSLRAQLMNARGDVLDSLATSDGILSVAEGGFGSVFDRLAGTWLRRHPESAVMAAGMIGSRQGWSEAAYLTCPAGFSELGKGLAWIDHGSTSIAIVPGLSTRHADGAPDVMRGEEVQVFGALDALGIESGMFVLPGTHSKWVRVENRRICQFHTFMTGEIFALLRHHSILSRTMPVQDMTPWEEGRASFTAASALAAEGTILHRLFSIRAQGLSGELSSHVQPDYLSGLVIGEEIREALALIGDGDLRRVYLVCSPELFSRYKVALGVFGVEGFECAPQASFRGMLAIARSCGLVS